MKERLPTTLKLIIDSLSLEIGVVPKEYKIKWSQELVSYYDSSANGYFEYDHTIEDDLDDDQPRWKAELARYDDLLKAQQEKEHEYNTIDAPWKANGFHTETHKED